MNPVTMEDLRIMLESHIAQNDEDHRQMFDLTTKMDEAIRGNGKPGLNRRVDAHAARLTSVEEIVGEIKKMRQWFMYGALGIITMAVLNLLGWVNK